MFYAYRWTTKEYLHRVGTNTWIWKMERTGAHTFPTIAAAFERVAYLCTPVSVEFIKV
jgi:hypothetical protein